MFLFLLSFSTQISAQIFNPFTPRTSVYTPNRTLYNIKGDYTLIGNTNLTLCIYSDNSRNNSSCMTNVDIDNDDSTFNSSSAQLVYSHENNALSENTTIIYAGLYWWGRTNTLSQNSSNIYPTNQVKLKCDSDQYHMVTANSYDFHWINSETNNPNCLFFMAYTEVTDYVRQHGEGNYFVADIDLQTGTGDLTGNYGAWGMVVVYENQAMSWRDISFFDGVANIDANNPLVDIMVSGFHTVREGAVNIKMGIMTGEGDVNISGDCLNLQGVDSIFYNLSHSNNSTNNFFNSSITTGNNYRNPNLINNTGIDISVFNLANNNNYLIDNNQSSALFRFSSTGDTYYPFFFGFGCEVYPYIIDTACISYIWNDSIYDTSGAYTQHFTSSQGTDSLTTLFLTINQSDYDTINNLISCDSLSWNDTTYTSSGVYTQYFTNIHGCDSIVTNFLTVNNSKRTSIEYTVCDSLVWNDIRYTTSGDYEQRMISSSGCDSIVTLHLIINDSKRDSTFITSCDSLTWNDTTYTSSGVYTQYFTNIHGCDSIVTIFLTVNNSKRTTIEYTICDSLVWNDIRYTTSGDYEQRLISSSGCDSIVALHLTINDSDYDTIRNVTTCDSLIWNDTTYISSGVYIQYFTNIHGCDSIVTIFLTVNNSKRTSIEYTICDSLVWNNFRYTTSGDYEQRLISSSGCDSIVTLHLTINDSKRDTTIITSCDSLFWCGNIYTTTGVYYLYSQTEQGCDSVKVLILTLFDSDNQEEYLTICEDELPYSWRDTLFRLGTNSNTYFFHKNNIDGCDSIVTLHLTIFPVYDIQLMDSVCEGDSYSKHGFNVLSNETVNQTQLFFTNYFNTLNGCDSSINLELSVIDTSLSIELLSDDFCNNYLAELQVNTTLPNYIWNTGEITNIIEVNKPDIYSVTASSDIGCTVTKSIIIKDCGCRLFLPNAITPSKQDGVNDYFSISEYHKNQISNLSIFIYNRWGELIFHSSDKNFIWKGDYQGTILYNVVYNYIILYTDYRGHLCQYVGELVVI